MWPEVEYAFVARVVSNASTNGKLAKPMLRELSFDTIDWY